MLHDLILTDLPLEALVSLKHAINDELQRRKKQSYVQQRLAWLNTLQYIDIPYEDCIEALLQANQELLLSLPGHMLRVHPNERAKYLRFLLVQNWDFLFPSADDSHQDFYVYAHIDPRERPTPIDALEVFLKGQPFYVGKGTGQRAWDLKRNQGHGKRLKQIRDAGFPESSIVYVLKDKLTEVDALSLEAKLIYLFGSIYDDRMNGCLLNLADHIRPAFVGPMRKVPLKRAWRRAQNEEMAQG